MKISKILSASLVALSLGVAANAAHATPYVINATLSATPNTTLNGNNGVVSIRIRGWSLTGLFAPFNLAAGDTVQANLTFTSPVSIIDINPLFPQGNLQSLSMNFTNGLGNPGFTATTTSNISFTGTSGNFLGDPAANTQTGTAPSEQISAGTGPAGVNLTNSAMTFTGVSFFISVLSIPPQNAPFQFGVFNIGDELNSVPAPGALALLGLGLIGFGGLRRKKPAIC